MIQIESRGASPRAISWPGVVAAVVFPAVLAACGGGGGGSAPPPVTVQASATSTSASGQSITLTATLAGSSPGAAPTWQISGPGSLSATSGTSVTYTPPDAENDANAAAATVTITASDADGHTQQVQIALAAANTAGHHWTVASLPSAPWDTVQYANGLFVAGGASGAIATSPDGSTWTRRDTVAGEEWFMQLHSPKGWLLSDGTKFLASADGVTWTAQPLPAAAAGISMDTMAYANGTYVVLGWSGGSLASTDGVNWTASSVTGTSLAFGNGVFVIVQRTGNVAWSTDGIAWTNVPHPSGVLLQSVVFNNGHFVALDSVNIYTSADGKTWTSAGKSSEPLGGRITSVNGTLYAPAFYTYASTDDTTWARVTGVPANYLTTLAASPSKLVALTAYGGIVAGPDIAHMSTVKADNEGSLGAGTYADGRALWNSGLGIWSSADGQAWSQTDFAPGSGLVFERNEGQAANSVAHAPDGTIVISGELDQSDGTPTTNSAAFAWSADAVTWHFVQPTGAAGNDGGFGPVIHDGTRFVSVGSRSGYVHASTDGKTWTTLAQIALPGGAWITGLTYGNGRYVAVGGFGFSAASTDGVHWTAGTAVMTPGASATTLNMSGVTYAANKFIAVGEGAVAATSADGLAWTSLATPAPIPANTDIAAGLNAVTSNAAGEIVAVGNAGLIETSRDGAHWTVRDAGRTETLFGVTVTPTGFMISGDFDVVLSSTN